MDEHNVNICWQRDQCSGDRFLPGFTTGNHGDLVRKALLGEQGCY
jgi:hypothetical protein